MNENDRAVIMPMVRFPAMIDSWDEIWCTAFCADFFRVTIGGEILGDFQTYDAAIAAIKEHAAQGYEKMGVNVGGMKLDRRIQNPTLASLQARLDYLNAELQALILHIAECRQAIAKLEAETAGRETPNVE